VPLRNYSLTTVAEAPTEWFVSDGDELHSDTNLYHWSLPADSITVIELICDRGAVCSALL